MRKLLLAIVVCILAGSVAKADSFTISGPSGTLPLSTGVTIDLTVTTASAGVFTATVTIASGPDAGQSITTSFGCGGGVCTPSVVFTNDGMSGTDVIDGTLFDGSITLPATTSVTWGGSTTPPTGTPEPGTLSLLAAALAGPLALRRRLAK